MSNLMHVTAETVNNLKKRVAKVESDLVDSLVERDNLATELYACKKKCEGQAAIKDALQDSLENSEQLHMHTRKMLAAKTTEMIVWRALAISFGLIAITFAALWSIHA